MTQFRRFFLLHLSMLGWMVLVMLGTIGAFVIDPPDRPNPELDRVLQVVALVLAGAGYFLGSVVLFKKRMAQLLELPNDASARFTAFRSLSLLQWTLLEVPYLFCWICFYLTGNLAYPALALFLGGFFALLRPNSLRMAIQMRVLEKDLLALK